MEVTMRLVDELVAYENNPRFNDNAVDPVAESIRQFGFRVPILLDEDDVIIAGHTRLKAAKKLGMREVPCISCDDMTPDQVRAFRLVDNKVSEFADWDLPKLNEELREIDIPELDLEKFGFHELPELDIDEYLKDYQQPEAKEEEPQRIQCPHCGEWFDLP
jgi:ParB-like chromosome segregation protein Spo0J